MKVALAYIVVCGKSDPSAPDPAYYQQFHERFAATYRKFMPKTKHSLELIYCGGSYVGNPLAIDRAVNVHEYNGAGWDLGAFQSTIPKLNVDLAICCATPVYFHSDGWMERLVEAANIHGKGLYAPMASFQNVPHLRTSCFALHPDLWRWYPHKITNRAECCNAEHGTNNISMWARVCSFPVKMVTWSNVYDLPEWRSVADGFRSGDQHKCLVWDRHTDIFASASPEGRQKLMREADGYPADNPVVQAQPMC